MLYSSISRFFQGIRYHKSWYSAYEALWLWSQRSDFTIICLIVYNMFHIIIKIPPCKEWPVVFLRGLLFGPLLFFLYINDLSFVSNGLSTFMFAGDTSMLGHDKNISSLQSCVNENLQMVYEWMQVNKLSLNISKPHYMLFTRKWTDVHDFLIDNTTISRVKKIYQTTNNVMERSY